MDPKIGDCVWHKVHNADNLPKYRSNKCAALVVALEGGSASRGDNTLGLMFDGGFVDWLSRARIEPCSRDEAIKFRWETADVNTVEQVEKNARSWWQRHGMETPWEQRGSRTPWEKK
jgi:hypothetical protein